jgi:hypothetical protein
VDAELRTALPGTDMIEEPLNICSSICSADGSPGIETGGLSLRRVGISCAFSAPLFSVVLCRLIASKTLPIESPHQSFFVLCILFFVDWLKTKNKAPSTKH